MLQTYAAASPHKLRGLGSRGEGIVFRVQGFGLGG